MITVYGDTPARVTTIRDAKNHKARTLLLRCLSKTEMRAWTRERDACFKIDDTDARDLAYNALLGKIVTGWENVEGEFSIERISEVFMLPEFTELLQLIPQAEVPTAEDAKK